MVDFPTLIGAVKKADRSRQLYILAALFDRAAFREPVTAAEVGRVIQLHLGKARVPVNIPAALRKYTRHVRVATDSAPRLWLLTEQGVAWLRDVTKLPLPVDDHAHAYDIDVAIVCALEQPEFAAVVRAFGGTSAWRDLGSARFAHVYRETTLTTASGAGLRIVGTTSTSMGLTAASIVTTQLLMQYRPRLVLMLGIAAGTRDGNKRFGDVLVADPSVDYNSGKVVRKNGIRAFLPDPYPIGLNPRLRSVLRRYVARSDVFGEIRAAWKSDLPAGPNRLYIGPLGAADQVVDDEERLLEIQLNWRKLLGVEMEAYGVYRACVEAPDPKPRFASFKSVCDFAADKTDSWQEYAAHCAAEFAARFLRTEWDALWTHGRSGDGPAE